MLIDLVKNNQKILNFYRNIRLFVQKISGSRHPIQNFKNSHLNGLIHLGTKDYGGWTFLDTASLHKSIIISAGLGEDASFDVEFAKKYDAKVIIVDPTPRAISHFNQIISNLGSPKKADYNDSGVEQVSSYDLENVKKENLNMEPFALWNEVKKLKFFLPADHSHVSHSIINYQNEYSQSSDHIIVDSTTIPILIEKYNINHLSLLKLDIEGAELEVLDHLLESGIFPDQLLIEYDDLNAPSPNRERFEKISRIHSKILDCGYRLIFNKNIIGTNIVGSDFTYVKKELIET